MPVILRRGREHEQVRAKATFVQPVCWFMACQRRMIGCGMWDVGCGKEGAGCVVAVDDTGVRVCVCARQRQRQRARERSAKREDGEDGRCSEAQRHRENQRTHLHENGITLFRVDWLGDAANSSWFGN